MKLKLILNDGTEIELAEASYTKHFVVLCSSKSAFQKIWNKLTDENLSTIRIADGDTVLQIIEGATLSGTQTISNPDGSVTGHIYLEGGEYVPPNAEPEEAAPQESEE